MSFEILSFEALVHAVSGAMGSVTAMTVFFPLDTARLRLQGVINVLVTAPLWVVNTRLKLQGSKFHNTDIQPTNYRGIWDALGQISRDEGVWALWSGTFPSLLLVLNPAIQFVIYEGLKRQLRNGLAAFEVFMIGAVAKAVATTVTYPLQTIQSVLRVGLLHQLKFYPERKTHLNNVFSPRKFGMLGLFKGLEAKLLQTVLTAALMFLLYEKIASCTFRVMGLSSHHKHSR
uniref:Solute carrier family 25 member 17 n=1 Tax=Hippocampus comes TaxID=109280 RepID=A0A3Q2XN17_HIPCM